MSPKLPRAIALLTPRSEMFGTSEEEAPEFDHTEDTENGRPDSKTVIVMANRRIAKEIENLRKESQALNNIRQSMGSEDFAHKVFDKVFKDDINRLRSMDDMWKTRKPPNALDFDSLSLKADGINTSVAQQDQRIWSEAENFMVFCDR